MHIGSIAIDGGLILGILWFFGWPIFEYFEERQANKDRKEPR
jgi:hypothetical protein